MERKRNGYGLVNYERILGQTLADHVSQIDLTVISTTDIIVKITKDVLADEQTLEQFEYNIPVLSRIVKSSVVMAVNTARKQISKPKKINQKRLILAKLEYIEQTLERIEGKLASLENTPEVSEVQETELKPETQPNV